MKKIALEKQHSRKKRYFTLTALTVCICIALALAQLFLANRLAGFSGELSVLEKKEREIESQNDSLSKEIAKESSIASISKKAESLFFEAPGNFLIVAESESVALLR